MCQVYSNQFRTLNKLDLDLKKGFWNCSMFMMTKVSQSKLKGTKSEVEGSCSDQSDLKMLLIWIYVDYLFQQSGSTICSLTHLLSHSSAINKNYRKRCFKILISCLTDLDDCVFSEHNRGSEGSSNQAYSSCFYFRISWMLMEGPCFRQNHSLTFLQGLRSNHKK